MFDLFLALLRYGVVQLIVWFSLSQVICVIGASAFTYVITLCSTWHAMRLLDVYVETASLEPVR